MKLPTLFIELSIFSPAVLAEFCALSMVLVSARAEPLTRTLPSTDISVKTDNKVVTLSGFVESQTQAEEAVKVAKGVEGVSSVSDKLHVRDSKESSVKGYAGDAATAGPHHRWFQLSPYGMARCRQLTV